MRRVFRFIKGVSIVEWMIVAMVLAILGTMISMAVSFRRDKHKMWMRDCTTKRSFDDCAIDYKKLEGLNNGDGQRHLDY